MLTERVLWSKDVFHLISLTTIVTLCLVFSFILVVEINKLTVYQSHLNFNYLFLEIQLFLLHASHNLQHLVSRFIFIQKKHKHT